MLTEFRSPGGAEDRRLGVVLALGVAAGVRSAASGRPSSVTGIWSAGYAYAGAANFANSASIMARISGVASQLAGAHHPSGCCVGPGESPLYGRGPRRRTSPSGLTRIASTAADFSSWSGRNLGGVETPETPHCRRSTFGGDVSGGDRAGTSGSTERVRRPGAVFTPARSPTARQTGTSPVNVDDRGANCSASRRRRADLGGLTRIASAIPLYILPASDFRGGQRHRCD